MNSFTILLGSATEKSVDGNGEIKRGAYKTVGGDTGAYLVGDIVYDEKGNQIGVWDGNELN